MNYEKLGNRIREYRKKMNYTQETLAELAGISPPFLGHIERGTRKASLETLVALCNALQVSPHALLQDSLDAEILGFSSEGPTKQQMFLREVSDVVARFFIDDDEDESMNR